MHHSFGTDAIGTIEGTVMEIEKTLINDRSRILKVFSNLPFS